MNTFEHWTDTEVLLHNQKVAKMQTAKAHNLQAGVGEVLLDARCALCGSKRLRQDATKHIWCEACGEYTEPKQAEREVGQGGLQAEIRQWCASQWPPWKIIQARSDKRSTIPVGAHDMTIYASNGRVWNIEVKAKNRKLRPEQQVWAKELSVLGHGVFTVRSMDEFLAVVGT